MDGAGEAEVVCGCKEIEDTLLDLERSGAVSRAFEEGSEFEEVGVCDFEVDDPTLTEVGVARDPSEVPSTFLRFVLRRGE